MSFFNKLIRTTPPIGLDIGIDGVRMLQLDSIGKAVTALAASHCKFPVDLVENRQARSEFAIQAVKRMLAEGQFAGRRVVTCLDSDELHVKQTRMMRMNAQQRESAVKLEAAEKFGFEISPGMLHYLHAGEIRSGSEVRDELILLAASEQSVEDHVKQLDAMEVEPVCIDAEPSCVFRPFERFLRRDGDHETVSVIVDIGGMNTWVVFARGRQMSFMKSIAIGGYHFSRAVAKALDIEMSEAISLRHQSMDDPEAVGPDVERAVHEAVRPVAEQLTREISLCLRYCSVNFRGSRPDQVQLVGAQAKDRIVRSLLGEYISIECQIGHPLKNIDLSQVDLGGDHRGDLCEWTVAAGLALRPILEIQDRKESSNESDKLSA